MGARIQEVPDANEEIVCWRFEQLILAGYSPEDARLLASQPDVDWRLAGELLARGCPPELAKEIVR